MKVIANAPPIQVTVKIVAIVEFRPWPFRDREVHVDPAAVGTISGDATVTWASHRTFNLLGMKTWDRIVIFDDKRCAVAHRDHGFITVGTELVVK